MAFKSGNTLQVNKITVISVNEMLVCEVNGNYMHLKFDVMSSLGGETVSIYADTGYRKPIISRE
ncbi:unnamed protein product [Fusarium fujikuroi]|uniref:Uncharacterized protein n=1 Tax=Fusarium fujikuroi TaxID=5127 RepID=A0A9Q9RTB3_FUSFU|nr:unnamed protein product [Fusarium fujikuroi]